VGTRWVACIDKYLDRRPIDAEVADAINRLNQKPQSALGPHELTAAWNKRWQDREELRISFLDGAPEVHRKVVEHAAGWTPHINLELTFGKFPDAVIRISFREQGCWSYLGTDARRVDRDAPTMNFEGWGTDWMPGEDVIKRTVLHEFGHALGCVHEHQSPKAGIPWDVEKVFAFYRTKVGWSAQQTYEQVLRRYDTRQVHGTDWDSRSIMQYPVDRSLTLDGFEIPWNDELSPGDVQFIRTMYP
jgi:hypothetical protein